MLWNSTGIEQGVGVAVGGREKDLKTIIEPVCIFLGKGVNVSQQHRVPLEGSVRFLLPGPTPDLLNQKLWRELSVLSQALRVIPMQASL